MLQPEIHDSLAESAVKARNISNSEVTAWLSCRRMYYFAFVQELAPKITPEPLARGSIGHEYLEFYWKSRLAGLGHTESMDKANEAFINPCEPTTIDVLMNTQFIVTRFMQAHEAEFMNWKPLGVEQQFDLPLTSGLNITIKYDLYFEDLRTNKKSILDWKFAYDFWSVEDHDLNGQMPKYIAVLQARGYKVDGGYIQEIRTRPLGAEKSKDPKNLWKRTHYVPSSPRKRSVLKQHVAASLEIEKFRSLDTDAQIDAAIPVLNKHGACKFCNFKDLCNSMIEGKRDLSVDIRVGYQQSPYGYNKKPEDFFEIL